MVSKCCWREPAKKSPETDKESTALQQVQVIHKAPENLQKTPEKSALRNSNGSNVMLSFEDDCDRRLEITDLTKNGQISQNTGSCSCFI